MSITRKCMYCNKPSPGPWHPACALSAQAAHAPDAEPCYFRACTRPATTYTKILGYWEHVCSHHADRGYSLARSHAHIDEMLAGRRP